MSTPLLTPEEIKTIRTVLGYSEAEMAQALGMSDRLQFSAIEHGREKTSPQAFKKLLAILHKKCLRYPKLKHLHESIALRIEQ